MNLDPGNRSAALTRLLGVRYPIVQGGMQWVGRAELVSAVSNAGGLGVLTALTQPDPAALAAEIRRCRGLTAKPFGVNITMLPTTKAPPYEEYLDAAIREGVRILETAGNDPRALLTKAKASGMVTIHKCTSVRHALSAQKHGADVISIDGWECAGHPGEDDIGGLILIPAAAARLDVPVIASGGIADGRGMAAALALGAAGVNMGTRFCATVEAPIHAEIKNALVRATERDTEVIFRTLRNTARVLANDVSRQVLEKERRPGGCDFAEIHPLVAGARGLAALRSGEVNAGLVWAGQTVGLIHDIPTCAVLIERMMEDCRSALVAALQGVALPMTEEAI